MVQVKTQTKAMFAIVAFAAAILCFMLANTAQAQASGITQTAQTQSSITVSWTPYAQTETNYTMVSQNVQIGTDYSYAEDAKEVSIGAYDSNYTFTGLKAGSEYYIRVNYVYKSSSGYRGSSYYYLYGAKTLPGQVTGLKQVKWWYFIKSVEFGWTGQTGVDGYTWTVRKASNGKKVASDTVKYASSKPSDQCDVKNNVVYTVTVRAYSIINNTTYWGKTSKTAYLFTQPMCNNKTKAKAGKLTISWGKIDGVTGYKVYVSTKQKSGYKCVKTVGKSKKSVSIKKFKGKKISKSKKYYVYVVAKKKVGKTTYTSGKHYTHTVQGSSKPSINWTY